MPVVGQGRVAGVVVWSARAGSAGEMAPVAGRRTARGGGAAAGAAPGPAPPPGDSTPLDLRITQTQDDYRITALPIRLYNHWLRLFRSPIRLYVIHATSPAARRAAARRPPRVNQHGPKPLVTRRGDESYRCEADTRAESGEPFLARVLSSQPHCGVAATRVVNASAAVGVGRPRSGPVESMPRGR